MDGIREFLTLYAWTEFNNAIIVNKRRNSVEYCITLLKTQGIEDMYTLKHEFVFKQSFQLSFRRDLTNSGLPEDSINRIMNALANSSGGGIMTRSSEVSTGNVSEGLSGMGRRSSALSMSNIMESANNEEPVDTNYNYDDGDDIPRASETSNFSHATQSVSIVELSADDTLIRCCRDGSIDKVRQLLLNGASDQINELVGKEGDSETPLGVAAANGYSEICKLLLDSGAKVNMRFGLEMTALMKAAEGTHPAAARVLIENRANVLYRNKFCCSAYNYANPCGCSEDETLSSAIGEKGLKQCCPLQVFDQIYTVPAFIVGCPLLIVNLVIPLSEMYNTVLDKCIKTDR